MMIGPYCGSSRTPTISLQPVDHFLHQEAFDRRARIMRGEPRRHRRGCGAHRSGVSQMQRDTADLRLVTGLRRDDFHSDGKSDGGRLRGGFVGGLGQIAARRRQSVRGEERMEVRRLPPCGSGSADTPRRSAAA